MTPDPLGTEPEIPALSSIRRFLRPRPARERERCALCSVELPDEHPHLLEVATRRLACACPACALLFDRPDAARYRRVPRRVRTLTDFRMTETAWEALQLPIDLAFFVHSTAAGRVIALYPSPAGVAESLVEPDAWAALAAENPVLQEFEPDVEGLLVNRVGAARDSYRVGTDQCYRLVGLIRTHWRGLSGGARVWGEIAGFFDVLREQSS